MSDPVTLLLKITLWSYLIGALAGLIFCRRSQMAGALACFAATIAASCGTLASCLFLVAPARDEPIEFSLLPSLIPYLQFSIRLDPLSGFFLLIISVLAIALSIYSFGYLRGFS